MSATTGGAVAASASGSGPQAGLVKETLKGGGSLPVVTVDANAVQKFGEIEVHLGGDESSEPAVFIRGLESAVFHKDAARSTMTLLREAGENPRLSGGGRIKHNAKNKSIFIYGYSIEFGNANLPRVADLCQAAYPDFEVTWKEGGY